MPPFTAEHPLAKPPEQLFSDESYDIISERDIETLNSGNDRPAAAHDGSKSRGAGILPASSKFLRTIVGSTDNNRRSVADAVGRPLAQHPNKNPHAGSSKSTFPIRSFLKKHLTTDSTSPSAEHHRRASPIKSGSSPGSSRRRANQSREAVIACGSGVSPVAYHAAVASNSIVSQYLSPESTGSVLTEAKWPKPSSPVTETAALRTVVRLAERRVALGTNDPSKQANSQPADNNSGDAVKARLQSIWNNVKYGWAVKPHTNFSKRQPLWLLGECHKLTEERELIPNASGSSSTLCLSGIEKFRQDFLSRLWFTYRRDFACLPKESPQLAAAESSPQSVPIYPQLGEFDGTGADFMPSSSAASNETPHVGGNHTGEHERVFSTDCGWGCMLRSGQMLLAQALVDHFLGRQWRWQPTAAAAVRSIHTSNEQCEQDFMHRQIIRWCSDSPDSPFSLHSLVKIGHELGRKAGDWFGPATLAVLMKKALVNVHYAERLAPSMLTAMSPQSLCRLQQLQIYVARDGTINTAEIDELCTRGYITGDIDYENVLNMPPCEAAQNATEEWKYSLVIFIPALLGASRLNKMYINCIEEFLTLPQCCGIIGGRPRHSLYFVGYQTPYLIYLDPHYCQKAIVTSPSNDDHYNGHAAAVDVTSFPVDSFHCYAPRKMPYNKMDPSCTIGFYARTRNEFNVLRQHLTEIQKNVCQNYPIFCFVDQAVAEQSPATRLETEGLRTSAMNEKTSLSLPVSIQTFSLASGGRRPNDDDLEIDSGFVVL